MDYYYYPSHYTIHSEDIVSDCVDKDNIICAICIGVTKEPVELVTEDEDGEMITVCHHTFCKSCIEESFGNRPPSKYKCPICNRSISSWIVSHTLKRVINDQRIKCNLKHDDKICGKILVIKDLSKHVDTCPYMTITCRSCQTTISRCERHSHDKVCSHRQIRCKLCDKAFPHKDRSLHKKACLFKKIRCKYCQQSMMRIELKSHKCDLQPVICDLCDYKNIRKFVRYEHVCPKELIPCPKCYGTCERQALHLHPLVCGKEEVSCPYSGCDKKMLRMELPTHRSVCPYEIICCPLMGCNYNTTRQLMYQHVNDCPRQLITCIHCQGKYEKNKPHCKLCIKKKRPKCIGCEVYHKKVYKKTCLIM